jgi:putative hemolysin
MQKEPLISKEEFAKSLKLDKFQLRALATPLMKLLKLDQINKVYQSASEFDGVAFIDKGLQEFHVRYEVDPKELENIPQDRPFIAIANHPYGGIDGMIFISAFSKVRPDFRILANYLLQSFEPIKDYFISVNPFEDSNNKQMNIAGVKTVLAHINSGKPIGIFPAGEVSSFQTSSKKIADKEWNPIVGRIISKAKVDVLPVYFAGNNSALFNILGLIHPNLRTARLPSEMLNKSTAVIKVRIGKPIPAEQYLEFSDNSQMLRYLRAKTYALSSSLKINTFFKSPFSFKSTPEPVVSPTPPEKILADIAHIEATDLLLSHLNYKVFLSEATSIPNIMREIGRLREITFRREGEGTNNSIDIDEYDIHYHHLFIWDDEAKKIVGAYRIGKGKELYNKFKIKGFYLNELFSIDKKFAPILKKSLEMGRSFIVEEYQKKHISLLLLWKGVLVTLRRNPEYRYLIGPVSISNSFSSLSKELLVKVIMANYYDHELAKLVKPRKRFKPKLRYDDSDILLRPNRTSIQDLDMLISEIESSHSKIPVLLKKYILQLNSKIIGFNIDPKFNNALDGFIVMDLENVPPEVFRMLDKEKMQ